MVEIGSVENLVLREVGENLFVEWESESPFCSYQIKLNDNLIDVTGETSYLFENFTWEPCVSYNIAVTPVSSSDKTGEETSVVFEIGI